ncbi:YybS family protein [Anaerovibrio sp. RM50]|uniref:YybS family protein n=1 Tax=Anaerovibrio sp. RM50 TaxID=1200557 RepID=UPI00048454CA|nr:YybS family protein [Anaerovibrio sp. RM50]
MADVKIKSMTESSLLAAITVIVALAGAYVPLLGDIAILIWPLPILVLVVRHGIKWALLSVLAAGIIMAILIEPMTAVRMVAGFAPPAIALGYGFRKQLPASQTLLISLAAAIIAMLAALAMLFAMTGINPLNMQLEVLEESFNASISAYETMGVPPEKLAEMKDNFGKAFQLVGMLMPLVVVCSGLITTGINFIVGRKVLKRLGHQTPDLPSLDQWRLPVAIFYFFGFSLVGIYWGESRNIELLKQASYNVFFLTSTAGFVQGVAMLSCLLRNKISRLMFWIIIGFIFINGLIAQLLAFVGLFDMIFDYRKRFSAKRN